MTDTPAVRILSAGAPKTGVRTCAETFAARCGQRFELELATAPVIKARVAAGTADADIVVAPLAAIEGFAGAGQVDPRSVSTIGSVRVGVVVRNGAREPDLTSVEAFTEALLAADTVVYNEASSGQYIARMLADLGIADELAATTVIVPTGAAVMQHLVSEARGAAIGFGHFTEIRFHDYLGTHLVGPLPEAIGRATSYAVALLSAASRPEAARRLIDFMTSADGKRAFVAAGVN
jgi:molybdate transport system substrate-binding protein